MTTNDSLQVDADDQADLFDLAAMLYRRRRITILGIGSGVVLALLLFVVLPSKYTATTSFVPEVPAGLQVPGGLAGLAGELGLGLGGGSTTSPRFFADALKSRTLLDRALLTRLPITGEEAADSARLLDVLDVSGDTFADSLEDGRETLADLLRTDVDLETSVVTLKVTTEDRTLSAGLANTLMSFLDEFNTTQRRTNAREQRQFIETRLATVSDDLRGAELRLRSFYETNRTWQQSPSLVYEEGQLRRRVEIVQDVFLTLNREYEKARIDELNDTPALTIIDSAIAPRKAASPKLGLFLALGLVLGAGAGLLLALGLDLVVRVRRVDPTLFGQVLRVPGVAWLLQFSGERL